MTFPAKKDIFANVGGGDFDGIHVGCLPKTFSENEMCSVGGAEEGNAINS